MSPSTEFPSETTFLYIPYTAHDDNLLKCGMPVPVKINSETEKQIVLVAVPANFSPTCSNTHVPAFISKEAELKAKGVDKVIVLSTDNPFSNSAWAKALGVESFDFFVFATDCNGEFSQSIGFGTDAPWGKLAGRWAGVVKNGKFVYAEADTDGTVTNSSVNTILAKL